MTARNDTAPFASFIAFSKPYTLCLSFRHPEVRTEGKPHRAQQEIQRGRPRSRVWNDSVAFLLRKSLRADVVRIVCSNVLVPAYARTYVLGIRERSLVQLELVRVQLSAAHLASQPSVRGVRCRVQERRNKRV